MSDVIPFTPVPVRARRDGWTPATQAAFIAALAATRNVTAAAQAVGRSWQTAYRLRARPDAAGFAAAWDAALAGPDLTRRLSGRAIDGIAAPITYRGRQIGERRRYDNRLARYILRVRAPDRYGLTREDRPAPPSDLGEALAALRRDLAAGLAPRDEHDFPADVARGSSPSGPALAPDPEFDLVAGRRDQRVGRQLSAATTTASASAPTCTESRNVTQA